MSYSALSPTLLNMMLFNSSVFYFIQNVTLSAPMTVFYRAREKSEILSNSKKPGAADVLGSNRGTPVKHHKGTGACSSSKES